jgi:transcriptional regulator with XRE-family HTH domain
MHPLQGLRKAKGMTQRQVADWVHLKDRSAIAQWERGRSVPTLDMLPRLAALYGVSLETLIEMLHTHRKRMEDNEDCYGA